MSDSSDSLRIGVDLGGTKTEAVVVRLGDEPEVLARKRVPTQRDEGYQHILDATGALVRDVAREAGLANGVLPPIGVGMPGSVTMRRSDGARSDVALVKNSNTTVLNGRPFHDDLSKALGTAISFANDANCFALAEATWGAARGAQVAFGVILGTGVGGGVVLHGHAWNGAQGIAGEWGHVTLDPISGPPCYCGRRGCIEQFLSGPAMERAYAELTGETLKLPEIARRPEARAFLSQRVDMFGRALATVINVLDPEVVVLGGGVSNLDIFYDEGPSAVARWVFNDALETRIVRHALGDSAGVYGAALLTA